MKILNKDFFFGLLPRLNVLLIVSACFLTAGLYSSINRTYDASNLRPENKKARPLELIAKGASQEAAPFYQEDVFRKKQLFNLAVAKKAEQEKKVFLIQGISTGKKNIAVIRDVKANKDYYCSEGDMIGDYRVKEIMKEKVVLESEAGTLEISR